MITNYGRDVLVRYFVGYTQQIAKSLAVGIGESPASVSDERLEHQIASVRVSSVGADLENNRIVFKGRLPAELDATIYEVGAIHGESPTIGGSRQIFNFAQNEQWEPATFVTDTRYQSALSLTPAASSSQVSILTDLSIDLSSFSSADLLNVALEANSMVNSTVISLGHDASNFSQAVLNPTSGYGVYTISKGSMITTGTVDWSKISWARVAVSATAGGSALVNMDSIRMEDVDTLDPNYGLVGRTVLASPVRKLPGAEMDIEYSLEINV